MAWFAVYDEATGALKSQGSVVAAELPEGWAVKQFPTRPSFDWNPEARDFDIPQPVAVAPLRAIDFMRRFTTGERIAIRAARASDPVLDDFFDLLVVAGSVMVTDLDMVAGVGYLVQQGLIAAERAPEILEAP